MNRVSHALPIVRLAHWLSVVGADHPAALMSLSAKRFTHLSASASLMFGSSPQDGGGDFLKQPLDVHAPQVRRQHGEGAG